VKAEYINPVLSSVINALQTMAQLSPVPGKPSLKQDDISLGVVSGLIALDGDEASGSLAISFPEPVILDIYKRIMREDKSSVDDSVVDLVGELANIVMGGAKQNFESAGMQFGLTLPEMIQGEAHTINHPVDGQVIVLPLTIESGTIFVEFIFKVH